MITTLLCYNTESDTEEYGEMEEDELGEYVRYEDVVDFLEHVPEKPFLATVFALKCTK